MKKTAALLLISMLLSATAFASTYWPGTYAEGSLWTGSTWALAETHSLVGAQNIDASVTLEYELNGNKSSAFDANSNYHNSISASASIPSGAIPIWAEGYHRITVSGLGQSFSGTTNYNY